MEKKRLFWGLVEKERGVDRYVSFGHLLF